MLNDIIWQFFPDKTLVVTINTTLPSHSQLPIKTNVTVTYNLSNTTTVKINDINYQISNSNNILILDSDSSADGKRIKFVKIEI